MNAKQMAAEIKRVGLLRAGNLQDELNTLAIKLEEEVSDLRAKNSALQLSQDNIINALGITGDGPASKSVIEYVMGLVAEKARMREAIEFATAPDMWQEQHDGMLEYRYVDWYVDVLNAALEPKSADAAIAEIKASELDDLARSIMEYAPVIESDEYHVYEVIAKDVTDRAANLRAGRKG